MIMLTIMTTLSITFMWLNHPLSMGITIIIQTIIISMISGMILSSFWFSYIILITMLSGMLVLFIYMASVASNEKFNMSFKLLTVNMSLLIMSIIYQFMFDTNDNETISNISNPENLSLNNLFNMKHKYMTMTMVMYLFFTMITVSFIVNISEGPLRVNKK
nr:NADH dehydrogenase subunit 6 [Grypocephalus pallipectus]